MAENRQFRIVNILICEGKTTAPELARRLEVSVRTIYRDIDALSASGVPVYMTPGLNGGVDLLQGYVLTRAMLTQQEIQKLALALRCLPGPDVVRDALREKLDALFRAPEEDWLQVDFARWGMGDMDKARFTLLREAIQHRREISFTYEAMSGPSARRVRPLRLVYKGHAWYLQAYCLTRGAFRTFRLTRMRAVCPLEQRFDKMSPPPIDVDDGAAGFPPVVLRFAPQEAWRVWDEFDEGSIVQGEDGYLTVTASMPVDRWLTHYLLSFGKHVQVLSPACMADVLARAAREMFETYHNHDIHCQGMRGIIGVQQTRGGKQAMDMKFCQSCGMPIMEDEVLGTEANGAKSEHYCKYCYENGAFTGDMTMDQMIDFCAPHMVEGNPGMTQEGAREAMRGFFPQLLRWKK